MILIMRIWEFVLTLQRKQIIRVNMKNKTTILLGIIMALFGVMVVVCRNDFASREVVMIGGILVILASFISEFSPRVAKKLKKTAETADADAADVVATKTTKERAKGVLRIVVDSAAGLFGVVMLCMIDTFVPYIPVTFGLVIFVGAVLMFYNLAVGIRPVMLPGWMYIFPVVLLALTVAVYDQNTPDDDAVVMTLSGTAAIVYGIGSVLTAVLVAKVGKIVSQTTEIQPLDDDK
jgi:drug/metabolite transporter (DMT)-like permease